MVLKKAFVTGLTGTVGDELLQIFLKNNIQIIASSRKNIKTDNKNQNIKWMEWDLSDWREGAQLDSVASDIDAIVHLAAAVPEPGELDTDLKKQFDVNVRSVFNLSSIALIKKIPFLFLSGSTVYKNPFATSIKENAELGISPIGGFYGYTKKLSEDILEHQISKGLNCTILRPSSIYGLKMNKKKIIPKMIKDAFTKKIIELRPPLDEKINFIHARDVANAVYLALIKNRAGIYNIASQSGNSLLEIAEIIKNKSNCEIKILNENNFKINSLSKYQLDSSKALSEIGFEPKVSLNDGILEMCNYFKK